MIVIHKLLKSRKQHHPQTSINCNVFACCYHIDTIPNICCCLVSYFMSLLYSL